MTKKTVVVTGFGPFGSHSVNASWECVKQLKKIGLGDDVDLYIYEIPVAYSTVKKQVPELWDIHKPDLVVHVGVSSVAKEITLEQKAHNNGYNRKDVQNCIADSECCVQGGDESITAGLNMELVCTTVNGTKCKPKTIISHDAGRYLCDFSYYTSLHINKDRSAFIHVPPLDQPYSVEELALGLRETIFAMLKQIQS